MTNENICSCGHEHYVYDGICIKRSCTCKKFKPIQTISLSELKARNDFIRSQSPVEKLDEGERLTKTRPTATQTPLSEKMNNWYYKHSYSELTYNKFFELLEIHKEAVLKLKKHILMNGNLSNRIVKINDDEYENRHDLVLNNIVCEYIDEIFGAELTEEEK